MRTTISLPPSLHAILSSLAHHAGRSLNDTMVELIEKGLSAPSTPCTGEPAAVYRIDATTGLPIRGIQGHRQVTDAYLVELARHHRGVLVTFDRGLAALNGDGVERIGG